MHFIEFFHVRRHLDKNEDPKRWPEQGTLIPFDKETINL